MTNQRGKNCDSPLFLLGCGNKSGCSITAIMTAFQAVHAGSTPATRKTKTKPDVYPVLSLFCEVNKQTALLVSENRTAELCFLSRENKRAGAQTHFCDGKKCSRGRFSHPKQKPHKTFDVLRGTQNLTLAINPDTFSWNETCLVKNVFDNKILSTLEGDDRFEVAFLSDFFGDERVSIVHKVFSCC